MLRLSVISTNAVYQLSSSVNPVDEGAYVTITLNTSGVQMGQAIPYEISGSGITLDDFDNIGSLSGNFVVQDGSASVVLHTTADMLLEGVEQFLVRLVDRPDVQLAVDVNDTSSLPPASFWWSGFSSSTISGITTSTNQPAALIIERDIPADADWWGLTASTTSATSVSTNQLTYQEI